MRVGHMVVGHRAKVRGGAAVAGAAALVLTLSGCGGGDDGKAKQPAGAAPVQSVGGTPLTPTPEGSPGSPPAEAVATSAGPAGIVLTIDSALRDQGGFFTVSGRLRNGGTEAFVQTAAWRGDEKSASAASVAGATLTDKAGKKRYYVLRDTEGRCLCTIGITRIAAGETVPFFAQFPAPPTGTAEVEFSLPTFAPATIKISG